MASHENVVEARIHRITTVRPDARRDRRALAECPREHAAVDVEVCATCPHARGFVAADGTIACAPTSSRAGYDAAVRCAIERSVEVAREPGTVGALMRRDVVCVLPDVDLDSVVLLFVARSISGVPVVDDDGKPIGMVSKSDLIQAYGRAGLRRGVVLDSFDADVAAEPDPATAREVMTLLVFTLREHEPIARAAELFASKHVHRAPVVGADGRVVGVLTSFDIVRALAGDL